MIFYDDVATAILRMEVVIRLEAMQPPVESKLGTRPVQHIVNPSGGVGGSSSQAAAKIRFLGRAPAWAPLVFVTILVVVFAQIDNKVRSSAPTALDHSQTKAGSELDARDHKRANQSTVPPFATIIEESVSGARDGNGSMAGEDGEH